MRLNGAGTKSTADFTTRANHLAGAAFDRKKVWWTAAEGLNALLFMHRKYGDRTDRYWKAFLKQWDFIEKHLLDPVHGGWYAETTFDGKRSATAAKAGQWKANYHTSRAMMNVARMLEESNSPALDHGLEPSAIPSYPSVLDSGDTTCTVSNPREFS